MPAIQVGDRLPDFTLPLATAAGTKTFRLQDHLGKGDLLFAIYPLAFTGTCTKELCDTRDSLKFFEHVGAQPFGFSADTPQSNRAFLESLKLNFPIISDPNRQILPQIWELARVGGVENVAKRGVVIVDRAGVVKHVWRSDDPNVWPGLDEARRILHAGHHH